MSEPILLDVSEKIGTITLNRPEKLNAFDDAMLDAWLHAIDECSASDAVNVIVITGTGRAFTTGADTGGLAGRAAATPAAIEARAREKVQALPRRLEGVDKPVIAAVNGLALGAGMDVAMMCDIRFAAQSARFAEVYARLGLIPGAGGAYYLPRLVGTARALELLWSADFVDAQTAERIGLVNRVFPDDALLANTREFALRVAKSAPLAVRITKRLVYQGLATDMKTALDLAAASLPLVRTSEDHQEAVLASREKREPVFNGR